MSSGQTASGEVDRYLKAETALRVSAGKFFGAVATAHFTRDTKTDSGFRSNPSAWRESTTVSQGVVPLPHIGSSTTASGGSFEMLMSDRTSCGKNLPRYS